MGTVYLYGLCLTPYLYTVCSGVMNTAYRSDIPSYEQALPICAALFLDILKGALANREKAAIAQQRLTRRPQTLGERVCELLRHRGPLAPREMRAIVGCSSMTLTRALRTQIAAGRLEASGNTRNLTYQLVKRSEAHAVMPTPVNGVAPTSNHLAAVVPFGQKEGAKGACYDAKHISTSKRIDTANQYMSCGSEVGIINQTKNTETI